MSEQKYYVFQKSVDGKERVSQLVRCKFMSENAEFMPVSKSKSCRYENSFSEFTKIDLTKISDGALYQEPFLGETGIQPEWINPLIELVPVGDDDVSN